MLTDIANRMVRIKENKSIKVWFALSCFNIIMKRVSVQLYLISFCFIFLYALYTIFKQSTPKTKVMDLIFVILFVSIVSLVASIYFLFKTDLLTQFILLIFWLSTIAFLYTENQKAYRGFGRNGTLYAIIWFMVVIFIYSCMFLAFGTMDYKYLESDLNIQIIVINENANVQSILLYFGMIGYYAIMTFFQMPIQDKIGLVASNHGWIFSFQIFVVALITIIAVPCTPKKIKEIYKGFNS